MRSFSNWRIVFTWLAVLCAVALLGGRRAIADENEKVFRAGAYAIDITPEELPVLVNGGMASRTADKIVDRLHARALVLDDGTNQIAIVVVDSCMLPRALLEEAKELASKATGIPTAHMLISATHTHSAPAAMGCLGTDVDEKYAKFLPARIARGIQLAHDNLEPARIGWGKSNDPENVYNRRWLMKEGTAATNPFSGKSNDRAQMNPGNNNPNKIKQTGTVDDEVWVLSVQSKEGRPIALLANYSTHYAGSPALSADYFGVFAEKIAQRIVPPLGKGGLGGVDAKEPLLTPPCQGGETEPPLTPPCEGGEKTPAFVGIMSNGTSGDTNCVDFSRTDPRKFDYHSVAEDTARAAFDAYGKIKYFDWVPIVMEEGLLTVDVRMPSDEVVAQAKEFLATDEGRKLQSVPAVYARETVLLSEMPPTRELKMQAIRIGELGIAAIPNEVYTVTGLAIKKDSPLPATFTIELANGAEGYIPPPDQHKLGGYTTWRARTSCLEENAEPKIRAKALELLRAASRERQLPESASNATKNVEQNGERHQGADAPRSPVSPEESLRYLHVRPGMKVELVAAEPLVRDPVAFDWGPDGKLWVVEYLDYPTGIDGKGTGGGRVVFLEDTDDDGQYDKSTLFVDGLNFPTGVMAWRKGVLITAAPDILYAEDTDGDGKADVREALYTGFFEGNQQLRVNGLRWGLDNWIYCASGAHHGDYGKDKSIKSAKTGELVHIGSHDFRIKPDEGLIEPVSGPSQFGRNRDAWGNWFGCQNAKPMWHFVLDDRYLSRNPHVAPPPSQILLSDVPGQRPVFPRSQPGKFHHASQAGRFTSANSAMIYGDELLGEAFIGNSFVSEPVHNLVHREIVERDGVTFKSHKPADEEDTEFLASEDTWFRPTTIRTGPDGALWIADMYREIIEHPQWVSDDLKPTVDTRSGNDRGRIYRIYPEDAEPRKIPRLDKLNAEELIAHMESPSATLRDMVQIQIVTRKLEDAAKPLQGLVREGKRPETRLQALCTLEGLTQLQSDVATAATSDKNPWVRCQALRALESIDGGRHLLALDMYEKEADPSVRLQYASSVGEAKSGFLAGFYVSGLALEHIASNHGDDPFIRAAVLSSLHPRNIRTFTEMLCGRFGAGDGPSAEVLEGLIETALGNKHTKLLEMLVGQFGVPYADDEFADWQLTGLAMIYSRLATLEHPLSERLDVQGDGKEGIRPMIGKATAFSHQTLRQEDANLRLRLASLKWIAAVADKDDRDWGSLASQLQPNRDNNLQSTAVAAMVQNGHSRVPDILMQSWKSHSPQLRSQVLDALLSRPAWTEALLTSIENGEVAAADLDAVRRERLLKSGDQAIRAKAAKLLAGGVDDDRVKVVAKYEPVLALLSSSDSARGKEIFAKRCAACHRVENVGNEVGPDLAGLTDKSPANLLASILDPNRAVEPKFVSYTAVTKDGRLLAGMLADESGGSLTLLDAEGKQHTLLRRDLDELKASGKSLMPEGLEQDIPPDDMRDLLTYLQQALNGR